MSKRLQVERSIEELEQARDLLINIQEWSVNLNTDLIHASLPDQLEFVRLLVEGVLETESDLLDLADRSGPYRRSVRWV